MSFKITLTSLPLLEEDTIKNVQVWSIAITIFFIHIFDGTIRIHVQCTCCMMYMYMYTMYISSADLSEFKSYSEFLILFHIFYILVLSSLPPYIKKYCSTEISYKKKIVCEWNVTCGKRAKYKLDTIYEHVCWHCS
jgi:hypothetical protein